jgi:hypothetical protein
MLQVERNAADIGLVDNIGRQDLERDRKADFAGDPHGIVDRSHGTGFHDRDSIGGQHRFRLRLGQHASADGKHVFYKRARRGTVFDECGGNRCGHLHQQFLVAAVAHHLHEAPHGLLRRLVSGNAGVRKAMARRRESITAEPACEDIA